MSMSELNRLKEAVRSAPEAHTDLTREMAAAGDAAGISEVLQRHGYAVSKDEIASLIVQDGALSDDKLEGISGGTSRPVANGGRGNVQKLHPDWAFY